MSKSNVQLAVEALQLDDGIKDNYFDPSKKALVSTPPQPHDIEKVLPQSTVPQTRTVEILTSSSYATCVKKLAHYFNMPLPQIYQRYPNAMSFVGITMQTLQQVMMLEQQHKAELEKLAVDVVLNLPEFSMFKELVENGTIQLDVKLGQGELGEANVEEELEEQQELVIDEIAMPIAADPEKKLKRAFHNFLTQGNALHKSYLFNMVNEELEKIDPTLPTKYGLIMSVTHILYYGTPYMSGPQLKGAGGGSEHVEGDKITIRGLVFPILVHEVVKGLFDYLGQDISPETHGTETLEDEYMQLMTGPEMYQKLFALIPNNKIKFFPLVYRMLLKKSIEEIKSVIANSPQGKRLIDTLVMEAERQHEMDQEPDEPEQYQDSSGGDDDYGAGGYEDDDGDGWKNA